MFYSEFVLAKKSPLGNVWLAAHWSKKLTHAMIARSDVVEACNFIIHPTAPLALRTSGHLLLGVVRIHDSKQKALMADCSSALVKIKVCFAGNDCSKPRFAVYSADAHPSTFACKTDIPARLPSDRAPSISPPPTQLRHSML